MAAARGAWPQWVAVALVLGLGATGMALPGAVLVGGLAWLAFLIAVLSGWGYLVARIARMADPDLGLRAVWGAAAYIAVCGVAVALGVCTRAAVLGFIALGFAAFAWRELTVERPSWHAIRDAVRYARAQPMIAMVVAVLVTVALLQMVGAVAQLDRNPWDDDISYTPLVKRLLDVGNQIEPFSFRRLAAYGGQTVLRALAGARGTLANVNLTDRGLCFGIAMLNVVGYARQLRRVPALWVGTVALMLLLMPDLSINTASYWSGAALFLGLYRTVALAPADDTVRTFALASLVAAATCTLRQNYLPVAVLFLVLSLAWRLRASTWRAERRTWGVALAVGIAVLVPWCIAAFESSHTFLYPFVQGTWNRGLELKPTGASWIDELQFIVTCCIETRPIVVVPVLFVLVALTTDRRPERPLRSLFIASTLGFLLLAHAFTGSDSYSLWRYAFGFSIPLTVAFAFEVANDAEDNPVQLAPLGRWVLLTALLVQVGLGREGVVAQYKGWLDHVKEAIAIGTRGDPNARVEARRYAAMQAAVPEHARLAVMLDDPEYLDFARNRIANLDTPGYASPGTQWPTFCGPAAVRSYFLSAEIRYVAFVRPESSRYFYRREFWVWRIFNDSELFQVMSAYVIDASDTFVALAGTVPVLYDHDGLVVLDLAKGPALAEAHCTGDERTRRDRFLRALSQREGLGDAWSLASRGDLLFEDGFSNLGFVDDDLDAHWYELVLGRPHEVVRGQPVRWMYRRAHVRVEGTSDMHLVLRGRVLVNAWYTRPRLDVSLDGELLGSAQVDATGAFSFDATVPAARLGGWRDLYIVFNSMGTPGNGMRDVRLARLEELRWDPVP